MKMTNRFWVFVQPTAHSLHDGGDSKTANLHLVHGTKVLWVLEVDTTHNIRIHSEQLKFEECSSGYQALASTSNRFDLQGQPIVGRPGSIPESPCEWCQCYM